MSKFQLESYYKPTGDQPSAISKLVAGINSNVKEQEIKPSAKN